MRNYTFAYITLENDFNTFTIANAKDVANDLKNLKKGDTLNIKGIGGIIVNNVYVDTNKGLLTKKEDYVYEDIEVACNFAKGYR